MTAAQLETLIHHIAEMTTLVYSKEKSWRLDEMILMPSAKSKAIEALSKRCPYPLPPSYIQFLTLHDGCLNFWAEYALLGASGKPREIVEAEIEDAREEQQDDVADPEGRITPQSIATFESLKDAAGEQREFYLPVHTVFGANEAGGFFLFNENKKTAAGEYEVIDYSYSARARVRYSDFLTFLSSVAEELEKRIRDRGYVTAEKAAVTKTQKKKR
jgi:SMI1/KNR4 family protein SUKH-1